MDFVNTILMSQLSDIHSLVIGSFAVLGIVEIIVSLFFFLAGGRVLRTLHMFQPESKRIKWWQYLNPNNPSQIQLMSVRIMISGLGMIITGICSLLATSDVYNAPYGFVTVNFFMNFGMMITSITHVLAVVSQKGALPGNSSSGRTPAKITSSDMDKRSQLSVSSMNEDDFPEPEKKKENIKQPEAQLSLETVEKIEK